ncbi:hypothetical protein AAIH64_36595, partial [Pseudomonas aeruginosa]|uniref:hypothetical protein n=1 Tax=Pseudomonas aeruginosa TaxID=287 RepID=UPI0031B69DF5
AQHLAFDMATDAFHGGSGLCGCGDREVLHGALLLNRKCKLLKSKELLNGETYLLVLECQE